MKYTSTLIAVTDMEKSRQFYHDVLGLKVVADFGANVTLDGGIALQLLDTWTSFIRTDSVVLPNNAGELYFEEEDMDGFCDHLKTFDICGTQIVLTVGADVALCTGEVFCWEPIPPDVLTDSPEQEAAAWIYNR